MEKIKPLLESLGLLLKCEVKIYEGYETSCMSLYAGGRLAGECFFREEEKGHFHIPRIDIDEECDRSKGYGSILMYATISHMYALEGTVKCTLTGFPSNFSFYVRNGYYDYSSRPYAESYTLDETVWYQLSVKKKQDILYQSEESYYKDRSAYFSNEDEQICLVFKFQSTDAIGIANQNIDTLIAHYKDQIRKSTLNKSESEKVVNRYNFLNGSPNNGSNDSAQEITSSTLFIPDENHEWSLDPASVSSLKK